MIEFIENKLEDRKIIDSYGLGGFRVQGELCFGNIFICNDILHSWKSSRELLSCLRNFKQIDLLIVGTGKDLNSSQLNLVEIEKNVSAGIELLNTPAACRLYNMLVLEGRYLGCALQKIE